MNVRRFPVLFFMMLLAAGHSLHADLVFSADQGVPNCMAPCTVQYEVCFDKAKDSPNDIERELCANEKKECVARCDAEVKEFWKELADKDLKKREEKALLLQQEKALLEQSGLTPEEQKRELRNRRAEEREGEESQGQEVAPLREQSEKAPQEQQGDESVNGIKIYHIE